MWVSARARPPHFQQGACFSSGALPRLVAWHPAGWRRPCLPGEAELKWSCSAHWPRPRSQLEVCTEEQQGLRKRLLWLPLPYDGLTVTAAGSGWRLPAPPAPGQKGAAMSSGAGTRAATAERPAHNQLGCPGSLPGRCSVCCSLQCYQEVPA